MDLHWNKDIHNIWYRNNKLLAGSDIVLKWYCYSNEMNRTGQWNRTEGFVLEELEKVRIRKLKQEKKRYININSNM